MPLLRIKKFFLDYIIGVALIILLFFLSIGNMTVFVHQPVYDLDLACTSPLTTRDVLHTLRNDLREAESCELISPCDESRRVQCESPLSINAFIKQFANKDLLFITVHKTLSETYGVWKIQNLGKFNVPLGFIALLLLYGVVLLEASATLFAVWRQHKLKQTLSLPPGSRRNQLLMPVVYAVFFGLLVVLINSLVFDWFDYPETEHTETLRNLINSGIGVLLIVVLAPLAEELVFRGALLRFFIERNRALSGTIIVSLLFSAFHGFTEQSIGWQIYISSIYFFVSIVLCRIYIAQKNIWTPILFHSAYNSTMVGLGLLLG